MRLAIFPLRTLREIQNESLPVNDVSFRVIHRNIVSRRSLLKTLAGVKIISKKNQSVSKMIKQFISLLFSISLLTSQLLIFGISAVHAQLPGEKSGRTLLPNGWWLTPAGESIELDDLPLNAAVSPDQRYLAVTHSGVSRPRSFSST